MDERSGKKASGYDKYVDRKPFFIAVSLFVALLLVPIPESMRDVAVEYSMCDRYLHEFFTNELFQVSYENAEQWQAFAARVLRANLRQGAVQRQRVLGYSLKQVRNLGLEAPESYYDQMRALVEAKSDEEFQTLMIRAQELLNEELSYSQLSDSEKVEADKAVNHIKVCFALVGFVIICFLTEAIPLPGVAFCIGLVLVFSGIVGRAEVAAMYWSDACWFIMGSLMFAVAFVKTGVDKRICLVIFQSLAKPSPRWITGVLILVISPAAALISDHALAAMFLPIAVILYNNSLSSHCPSDPELVRMLMITIAMACNIGGFGSPSGGARNVIMMTYLEDMFGYSIGYGQWIVYGFPFVLLMMPILWLCVNWRFKPLIRDMSPALNQLRRDIARMGGWNRTQVVAVLIFLVMLFGWITEKNLILSLTGVRLGIGVIAVAGAVAYLLFGIVNWRDYQSGVDWGVVWLYAGAILLGKVLDSTGTAYWIARSLVHGLAYLGLESGRALLAAGGIVTAGMTQLMADGPAAAAVGPITLNMAAVSNPGSALIPFMTLVTACASSMAYLLVIGTPPNAIMYAGGYLQAKDFLRVGVPCLISALVLLLVLSTIVWPLIGFPGLEPVK